MADTKRFRMPHASLGMEVLFYPEGAVGSEPWAALVTHIGSDTLALSAVEKDAPSLCPVDGVRHVEDPALSKPEARSNGAWDYTERDKEFMRLVKRSSELVAALELLTGEKMKKSQA